MGAAGAGFSGLHKPYSQENSTLREIISTACHSRP